uniref:C-type lectin domain-containing protein n=1 Tax=Esox lucius TaxID=8010 RepID=A0A6Q2YK26_ESOLU
SMATGLSCGLDAVLQITLSFQSQSTLKEANSCPEGWESFGEKCYLYSQDRWDWSSSQYHCLSAGGNLAMVKNEEEQV